MPGEKRRWMKNTSNFRVVWEKRGRWNLKAWRGDSLRTEQLRRIFNCRVVKKVSVVPVPSDEIRMDKKVFEALASDTRIAILKELDQRQMTVTELANSLGMAKATVHEHLAKMVEVGLIEKEDSRRKWTYYRLTRNGRSILHPHEMTKILLLLGSSILAFLGGVSQVLNSLWTAKEAMMQEAQPSMPSSASLPVPRPATPAEGAEALKEAGAAYAREPVILGVLLIIAALILGYYAYRIWRKSRTKRLRVKG